MRTHPLSFALLLWSLQAHGALEASNPAAVFLQEEALAIRLEAPLVDVLKSRGDDAEYFPASLFYLDADGVEVTTPLRIKTRGNTRNREGICRFAPLMLNFATRQVATTIFAGEDRLKLVTHCQPRSQYHQYVLLEYLGYRTLNLLTDYSLRVRLLDIRYINNSTGKELAIAPGFLIEDIERFGARTGLQELQQTRLERYWYDSKQEMVVALFQYMIGNTDWSLAVGSPGEPCCHNIFTLQGAATALIPVPYDFDVTGLVNPRYGSPSYSLGQRRLTDRLYRGACPEPDLLTQVIALFVEQREAVTALYEQQPGLSANTRRRVLDYLNEFYAVITSEARVETEILGNCL